jgi:uncharacterized membrane protein YfhO
LEEKQKKLIIFFSKIVFGGVFALLLISVFALMFNLCFQGGVNPL